MQCNRMGLSMMDISIKNKCSALEYLSSKAFKECGRSDNRICDISCCHQLLFKLQLGPLELQKGLLHTDCGQQNEMPCFAVPGGLQR